MPSPWDSHDWNVILGITPGPETNEPEPVPQIPYLFQNFQIPEGVRLNPDEALQTFNLMERMQRDFEESKAASIRYEGQMDYDRMLKGGVAPDEALRRAGTKMFFRHPEGLTASLSRMQAQKPIQPVPGTLKFGDREVPYVQMGNRLQFIPNALWSGTEELGEPVVKDIGYGLVTIHVPGSKQVSVRNKADGKSANLNASQLMTVAKSLDPESDEYKSIVSTVLDMIPATKSIRDKKELEDFLWETSPPEEGGAPYETKGKWQWLLDKLPIKGGRTEYKEGLIPGVTAPAHIPEPMDQQAAALGMTNAPVPSLAAEPLGPPPPPPEASPVVPAGVAATNVAPSNAPPMLSPQDERRLFLMTNRTAKATAPGQRVRVKAPNGKIGTIPIEQLDEALKEGYERL